MWTPIALTRSLKSAASGLVLITLIALLTQRPHQRLLDARRSLGGDDADAGPSARRPEDPVSLGMASAGQAYSAAGGSGTGGKSPEKMSPTNSSEKPPVGSRTRMAERPS